VRPLLSPCASSSSNRTRPGRRAETTATKKAASRHSRRREFPEEPQALVSARQAGARSMRSACDLAASQTGGETRAGARVVARAGLARTYQSLRLFGNSLSPRMSRRAFFVAVVSARRPGASGLPTSSTRMATEWSHVPWLDLAYGVQRRVEMRAHWSAIRTYCFSRTCGGSRRRETAELPDVLCELGRDWAAAL